MSGLHTSQVFCFGLILVGSHGLNTPYQLQHIRCAPAVHLVVQHCLKGAQSRCARTALQREAQHMEITRRFASKAHSSYKLEQECVTPYMHQDGNNRSLLKTVATAKGYFIAGKGLYYHICQKSRQLNEQSTSILSHATIPSVSPHG